MVFKCVLGLSDLVKTLIGVGEENDQSCRNCGIECEIVENFIWECALYAGLAQTVGQVGQRPHHFS